MIKCKKKQLLIGLFLICSANLGRAQIAGSLVIQTIFAEGDLADSLIRDIPTVVSYPAKPVPGNEGAAVHPLARASQTGSVWGLAYDGLRKRLFASALAKRHAAFGPLGSGGIYSIDPETEHISSFLSLDALGFPTGPKELIRDLGTPVVPAHDSLMFGLVGKIGLGGIDLTEDGRFLLTVNLYDRKLYRIQLPSDGGRPEVSDIMTYKLPERPYAGGEVRPFAVKHHKGVTYVGAVFDAQDSQNVYTLRAIVYGQADSLLQAGKGPFKEIVSFGLDYPRGVIDYGISGWFPWTDNYQKTVAEGQAGWMIYPQPVFAEIGFDTDGDMLVSLMDRLGHQTGEGQLYRSAKSGTLLQCRGLSGGDLLRLAYENGKYILEQNGAVGKRVSKGAGNNDGPGGGEFYFDDAFAAGETTWHREAAMGGIALFTRREKCIGCCP